MIRRLSTWLLFTVLSMVPLRSAMALELVSSFDPSLGELPESIAFDEHGNAYMSMSNTIRKRTPAGVMTTIGVLPLSGFALGVRVGPDHCVYTVSSTLDRTVDASFVWRICEEGVVERFATLDQTGAPDDLAFDDHGNLYVTDIYLGQIWKVTRGGTPSVWLSHPLFQGNAADPALVFHSIGVDGIAFDENKRTLYVTNLDYGYIVRIPVQRDGSPGPASLFADDPVLRGADGLAIGAGGDLYVAIGVQNRVVSIDSCGAITVVAESDAFDEPAGIAFGTERGDKHSLYITNIAFSHALGLKPGNPTPSLYRTRVPEKGLDLP